jgi:MoaA/NifB/PqqE/SkfB family radical SAM enzyme
MSERVRAAVASGTIGSRLWFYANYHCNLACRYCLTESAPDVPARALPAERILALTEQAPELGFTEIGVTGGEPFLRRDMPELLTGIAGTLPTIVLTNGTLFSRRRLEALEPLVGRQVRLQISLDHAEAIANDEMRGPDNFRKVVEAIPRLVAMGIRVRLATTVERVDERDLAALCRLHRSLGVSDEDHVIRGIVRRGRARTEGLGVDAELSELPPELTITVDGAFWSPFGPTVTGGVLDVDLQLTRGVADLRGPAEALVGVAEGSDHAPSHGIRFT